MKRKNIRNNPPRKSQPNQYQKRHKRKKGAFDMAVQNAPNSTFAKKVMIWDNQKNRENFVGERQLDDDLFGNKRLLYIRYYRMFLRELRLSSKGLWIPYRDHSKYLVIALVLLLTAIAFIVFGVLSIFFNWAIYVTAILFLIAFMLLLVAIAFVVLWSTKKSKHKARLEDRERQFSMVCHDFNTGKEFTDANMEINTGRYGAFLVVILKDHLGTDAANIKRDDYYRDESFNAYQEEVYEDLDDQSYVSHDVRSSFYDSRPYGTRALPMASYRV